MNSIGQRIRFIRKKKNLTLTDIKKLTGLSTGNLSELENDKFMPSASALIALKNTLKVSIDWILTGEKPRTYHLPSQKNVRYYKKNTSINKKERIDDMSSLNEDEKRLLLGYRNLAKESQRDIDGFICVCLQRKYPQNEDPTPKVDYKSNL